MTKEMDEALKRRMKEYEDAGFENPFKSDFISVNPPEKMNKTVLFHKIGEARWLMLKDASGTLYPGNDKISGFWEAFICEIDYLGNLTASRLPSPQ